MDSEFHQGFTHYDITPEQLGEWVKQYAEMFYTVDSKYTYDLIVNNVRHPETGEWMLEKCIIHLN